MSVNNDLLDGKRVVTVKDQTFVEEVIKAEVPVLVDFWAEWCGPCRMIGPVVEGLAAEYAGKLKVAKVNVDENPQLSRVFNIRSIPTLLLFKDGNVVESIVGAVSRTALVDKIARHS